MFSCLRIGQKQRWKTILTIIINTLLILMLHEILKFQIRIIDIRKYNGLDVLKGN